jgi:topoisomerase-4 subunit A
VTTLIELQAGAKVAQAVSALTEQKYRVAGSGGNGFISSMEDMVSRMKAGKAFMTLEPDEEPLAPVPISAGFDHVAALSSNGKLLVFGMDEMREMPRGRGVIVMRLDHDERLIAIELATAGKVLLRGTNRVGREVVEVIDGDELAKYVLHRARKGWRVAPRIKLHGFARQA